VPRTITGTNLLPHHLRHLRDSGISDAVIAERGYQTVSRPSAGDGRPRDLLRRCGIPSWIAGEDARYPGLLIPIFRVTGELISWRYRPDVPGKDRQGKLRRYITPAGRPPSLDLHPAGRARVIDPTVPLWITEGVKKADALTTAGACVVALSGVHNWRSRLGTLGDWEDVPLRGRAAVICFDADANTNPTVAKAMDRLGRWLRSKGVAKVRYVVTPASVNGTKVKGADDYLAAAGTLDGLLGAAESSPPEIASADAGLTDSGVAQSFAESIEGRYCWADGLGWMRWDGRRWAGAPLPVIREQARQWIDGQHAGALEEAAATARLGGNPSHALTAAEAWRGYRSAAKIGAVVILATGVEWVMREAADFDAYPDLLNAANGVVDLRTGEMRPHDPALLLTKITAARYVRGAWNGDWYRALGAVPSDCRGWLRLRLGQAVTGYPAPDDVIVFGTGGGENGKTTVFYGVGGALGDYATMLSQRVLSPEHNREHPAELMDLRGARVALVEELPEGKHLSVQRVKDITQPRIKARGMRENWITWDSTHSLFVNSNPRPMIRETDHGTWRRLARMHWPFRFWKAHEWDALTAPGPQDRRAVPGLRERIRAGGDGRREAVLAWLVEGRGDGMRRTRAPGGRRWRWERSRRASPATLRTGRRAPTR
jgi:putative DNA primase/helicase